MLVSLLALASLASVIQDAPRLRTILPSGAVILVENMPQARHLSVQLFASARGVAEKPATHGQRHLLEHLLEKGPDRLLPFRLETQGMFLTAETHRDAIQFSIVAPPDRLESALSAIADLLQPLRAAENEIQRETRILDEERALMSTPKRLSIAAWTAAYAEFGLDPGGNPEVIGKSTTQALELLRRRHFAAQNLVVSVCGPGLDLDAATKQIRALLPKAKDPVEPEALFRPLAGKPGTIAANQGRGEAVAVIAPGWADPIAAHLLAAGLALASEKEGSFLTYTPSVQPGLIILGTDLSSGLAPWLAGLPASTVEALYPRGRSLAEDWIFRQLASPEGSAYLRGFLISQSPSADPEIFLGHVRQMSAADFRAACAQWQRGKL